jgi:hypothetical protein
MTGTEALDMTGRSLPFYGFKPSWDQRSDTPSPPARRSERRKSIMPIEIETGSSSHGNIQVLRPIRMQTSFETGDVRLQARKPVSIRISRGEASWFAENDYVDVFAIGETIEEAVHEFSRHLVHFFCHYRDLDEAQAMGEARRLKKLFAEEFVETAS